MKLTTKVNALSLAIALAATLAVVFLSEPDVAAQGGMSKATMKLLMEDLLEAGFFPSVRETGSGTYIVVVSTDRAHAATAAQLNSFANARSVAARVLTVQFE